MLSDFSKLETFLTVVRERSFSKASAKLGISQPAVTQQIKFIEDYLDTRIVDRKKNGIRLTKEGEQFLAIVQKIEKAVANAEKELLKIINKDINFILGTSFMIGNYLLPKFLNEIKTKINNDVSVNVSVSKDAIEQLLDKKVDMVLIESPIFEDGIIYREWLEDELVIFSNQKLPKRLKDENLRSYKWVCRNRDSHTRILFKEALDAAGMTDCDNFNMVSEATSPTTIVQTVLHSSTTDVPTTSIVSRHAISDYVRSGLLHEARITGVNMTRKLYIAYLKDRKHDAFIEHVVNYLMTVKV
ncbi:LysR family transcriptional regulator [Arcobacter sp. FWKO B]|uniref:LysR family transcriptional regulator n=1 Tax=Arcobacter sp. FWKO B TaxID=2593672 RepID=UPI0018A57CD6|nr:LysR family transcriptional regulator [Arcobacter sp. FWKO B]QOG11995.1 LysR family transcriptional regulator [Arcobacter sp. FWKO B]